MPSKKKSTPSTNKNISIGGDVVDSVVINGDKNIVNYFKGEYVSLKEHYIPPDSVFQRVRTEDFVGRDWLTVQVDEFLNDPQRKSGAFLLIGDAGVGKTSFMAHLVKERRYLHLFAEQVPGQAMLQRAIQSLGSQLVTRYQIDPYKDLDTLIQGTVFPDFLERLLRMAASKLTGGQKIVIVCDALDEAGTFPDGNVFGLPNVLPDGVYLILSQRPVNVKLPNLEPLTVRLDAQGADNLQDMEKYLRAVAQRASVADQIRAKNYSDAFFIQTLKDKSLGVWMYLHYVIKEIEGGSRAPLELEALPTGLVGYYADFWGDWRMGRKGRGAGEKAWNALYAPLLTTLAAAQEAITIGTLIQWAEVNANEDEVTRLVAEDWRAFIEEKEADAETRYKPYHLSFADFITGRADSEKLPPAQKNLVRDLAKRTVKAHGRIVKVFEAECNGQWEKLVEREYPRLHLSAHLNGAGEYETLRVLLTEGDEKIKWAEAREKKEETYAGYLNDLSYVWTYAEREQNYALASRCMLIENSIHSLAANIPPELLAELGRSGMWSYARCLETIRQKSDSRDQAESLKLLISDLPQLLYQDALALAYKIKEEQWGTLALTSLVPYFDEEFKVQILAATRAVKNEYVRADILANIMPYLNEYLKTQALVIAREIKDKSNRVRALTFVLPYIDDELKSNVLRDTLSAMREIKNEYTLIDRLSELAPYLDEEHKANVFTMVYEIKDGYARTSALVSLAPYLNNELKDAIFQKAISTARKFQDEYACASTLISLVPYVDEEPRTQIIQDVLSIAREVKDEDVCASILTELAPHLNNEFRIQALSIARKFSEEYPYANVLVALAPHLNNETLTQVLASACNIKDDKPRASALDRLVPHLNEELKIQAFAVICEIKNEDIRFQTLTDIIPHLTGEIKKVALRNALNVAREVKDECNRSSVLANLASYLKNKTKEISLRNSLDIAYKIKNKSELINALVNVAPHLNKKTKEKVLFNAIAESQNIEDKCERVHILASIAQHLNHRLKIQTLQEALILAREAQDDIEDERLLGALLALAPHLATNSLKTQALTNVRAIEDESIKSIALLMLAPHLTDKLKMQALSAVREIKDEPARASALFALVPHMVDIHKPEILRDAQIAMREIKNRLLEQKEIRLDVFVTQFSSWVFFNMQGEEVLLFCEVLEYACTSTLPRISPYYVDQSRVEKDRNVLIDARKLKYDTEYSYVLSILAPCLSDEVKTQMLDAIREIENEEWRANAFISLIPRLEYKEKSVVLQEILYLSNNSLLSRGLIIWKEIGFIGLEENIIPIVKFTSQTNRKDGVEAVGIITSALVHFSGEEIVPELYRAIQDTARWWP